ncbi:MAG: sulfurtransferase TusA family protein [Methylobacteriaceae bacterium]|nr:sulfurtransferase TusA family protein [Methylobacteriaceae bacterium]
MQETPVRLDLRGLKCPLPALKTRKALAGLAPGALLQVECTDPLAALDIPHLAQETGDALVSRSSQGELLVFVLRRMARRAP